jgi:hypothetical protein
MDAIVAMADGDMRCAINNLETTHTGCGRVTAENVYRVRLSLLFLFRCFFCVCIPRFSVACLCKGARASAPWSYAILCQHLCVFLSVFRFAMALFFFRGSLPLFFFCGSEVTRIKRKRAICWHIWMTKLARAGVRTAPSVAGPFDSAVVRAWPSRRGPRLYGPPLGYGLCRFGHCGHAHRGRQKDRHGRKTQAGTCQGIVAAVIIAVSLYLRAFLGVCLFFPALCAGPPVGPSCASHYWASARDPENASLCLCLLLFVDGDVDTDSKQGELRRD